MVKKLQGSPEQDCYLQTMIIAPKSEMEIPVNCSEKGRNEYKSRVSVFRLHS